LTQNPERDDSSTMKSAGADIEPLVSLVIESWRFVGVFNTVVSKLDPLVGEKFQRRGHFFQSKIAQSLEASGLRIVDLSGQVFDAGVAATALNSEEFEPDTPLVIDYMIEPLILSNESVIHYATVVVRKGEK